MNYSAPITTTVVPKGMSQQHEFATGSGSKGSRRARAARPTLFFVVMRTLRKLLDEKAKGKPAVVPARLRKAVDAAKGA